MTPFIKAHYDTQLLLACLLMFSKILSCRYSDACSLQYQPLSGMMYTPACWMVPMCMATLQ